MELETIKEYCIISSKHWKIQEFVTKPQYPQLYQQVSIGNVGLWLEIIDKLWKMYY